MTIIGQKPASVLMQFFQKCHLFSPQESKNQLYVIFGLILEQ